MARTVTRRTAIGYGLGAAAALALPDLSAARTRRGGRGGLPRPQVLRSRHGRLDVTLRARPAVVDLGAPRPVHTYTYNGVVPGHAWELRGGDLLSVDLRNQLPELEDGGPMRMDRPHHWTTTNLHTHGLHVSPRGISDNVFLEIPPGERQRYEIELPRDHPAGLFWYHPHHHGAVTQQVRAGMAGPLIVRGDLDEVPELRAAREHVMVLQAIEVGADYRLQDPIPDPTKEQAFFPRSNILYTVNGALRPRITMHPGEVQRWRLLNAAEGKFFSLRLQGHDLHQIAWDGLTLPAPEGAEVVMLSAGNRVELLVRARRPGRYELVLTPGSSQKPGIPGMPDEERDAVARVASECGDAHAAQMPGFQPQPGELEPRSILTLEVRGDGPQMRLPRDLPAFDPRMPRIRRRRRFAFTVARDPDKEFLSFGIDGRAFDPQRPPYRARLGTAEEWTLVNALDTKLMDHAHVYHVHVNPFRITRINGKRLSTPLWRDTFVLTRRTGDSITFETHFQDYTGRFVEHCHVLSHEDLGMMGAVEVVR